MIIIYPSFLLESHTLFLSQLRIHGVRTTFVVIDVGNADLGEMAFKKLSLFGPRRVIPVKERYVGNSPTEGSEKTGFKAC